MFCSVKFLSPSVTPGFPTPGPVAAAGAVVGALELVAGVLALVALELLEDELLLPHAASAIASATTAKVADPPLIIALELIRMIGVIRRLLVVCLVDVRPYI
jgi:hypothetical protein